MLSRLHVLLVAVATMCVAGCFPSHLEPLPACEVVHGPKVTGGLLDVLPSDIVGVSIDSAWWRSEVQSPDMSTEFELWYEAYLSVPVSGALDDVGVVFHSTRSADDSALAAGTFIDPSPTPWRSGPARIVPDPQGRMVIWVLAKQSRRGPQPGSWGCPVSAQLVRIPSRAERRAALRPAPAPVRLPLLPPAPIGCYVLDTLVWTDRSRGYSPSALPRRIRIDAAAASGDSSLHRLFPAQLGPLSSDSAYWVRQQERFMLNWPGTTWETIANVSARDDSIIGHVTVFLGNRAMHHQAIAGVRIPCVDATPERPQGIARPRHGLDADGSPTVSQRDEP